MPGAAMNKAVELYEKLKKEWSGDADVYKCETYLNQLKIALLDLSFLPTDAKPSKQEVLLARELSSHRSLPLRPPFVVCPAARS